MTNRLFAELRAGRADAPLLSVTMPVPEVVESLNAYKPEALITYPSFVRRLAEEQQAGRLRIAPRQFCTAAETLTQDVRDLARETWGAAVLNAYGATEANLIGIGCPWAAGLHVPEDLLVLEVVDENDRPVPPGVAGHKVLITTLFNRTMPFIRYELSDLVTVAEGPCPCGRPHLRLASVQGRREDVLSLPARQGGRVSVHAIELQIPLNRMPEVRQVQVSPRPAGLLVRVVLRDTASTAEVLRSARRALAAELDRVGAAVEALTIEAVDEIGRTGTGAKEKLVSRHACGPNLEQNRKESTDDGPHGPSILTQTTRLPVHDAGRPAPHSACWPVRCRGGVPNGPVRVLTPSRRGRARFCCPARRAELTEVWGQQVVVDSRPGGNGFIAIGAAKKAEPDGYTLVQVDDTHLALQPHLYKKIPYDIATDFDPSRPCSASTSSSSCRRPRPGRR